MSRTVIRQQGGISVTRLICAGLTLGASIPFLGIRRRRRTTIRS